MTKDEKPPPRIMDFRGHHFLYDDIQAWHYWPHMFNGGVRVVMRGGTTVDLPGVVPEHFTLAYERHGMGQG